MTTFPMFFVWFMAFVFGAAGGAIAARWQISRNAHVTIDNKFSDLEAWVRRIISDEISHLKVRHDHE